MLHTTHMDSEMQAYTFMPSNLKMRNVMHGWVSRCSCVLQLTVMASTWNFAWTYTLVINVTNWMLRHIHWPGWRHIMEWEGGWEGGASSCHQCEEGCQFQVCFCILYQKCTTDLCLQIDSWHRSYMKYVLSLSILVLVGEDHLHVFVLHASRCIAFAYGTSVCYGDIANLKDAWCWNVCKTEQHSQQDKRRSRSFTWFSGNK